MWKILILSFLRKQTLEVFFSKNVSKVHVIFILHYSKTMLSNVNSGLARRDCGGPVWNSAWLPSNMVVQTRLEVWLLRP
jgi:hypothetical protein